MSDKFIFQNARIKSMESKLLSSQTLQRLAECSSLEDAFKILIESGWGASGVETNNFDAVFAYEEELAVSVLRNFNSDGALDAFLLFCDYHNAKALLKAKISGNDKPVLMPEGIYSSDAIKDAIIGGDVTALPEKMGEAIKLIEKLTLEEKITPHAIDTILDKAAYGNILAIVKKSGRLAREYFIRKIDYLNILSFIRCRKLGLSEKFFEEGFVEGGELSYELFTSVFESPVESLKDKYKYTPYRDIVETIVDTGTVSYEVETDNALYKMWKDENNDMFSIAPIVSYYFTKTIELKIVKLIVAGIKNNVAPQLIKERMRDLYA